MKGQKKKKKEKIQTVLIHFDTLVTLWGARRNENYDFFRFGNIAAMLEIIQNYRTEL